MKPSPGRIVHYHVPDIGWRPMLVTGVETTGHERDPSYTVSGWAKLDPHDLLNPGPAIKALQVDGCWIEGSELAVFKSTEGTRNDQWRWPPRVT